MAEQLHARQINVDGSRLHSLSVIELRTLLDMRVAALHRHLADFKNTFNDRTSFDYVCSVVDVINAITNSDKIFHDDGELRPERGLTHFLPPLYPERDKTDA